MSRVIFAVAFAWIAACSDEGPSPEALINEARILAVQAEPPVVAFDESAALTALVVGPEGERSDIQLSFRACYPWQPMLSPDRDCGPQSSIPLTDGVFIAERLVDAFPPPVEVLERLQALGERSDDCDAAYAAWDFPIVVEAQQGDERLVTSKRIRVTSGELPRRRTNPRIETLVFDGTSIIESALTFVAGTNHGLSLSVARDAVDDVCDEEDPTTLALEDFRVNFYATGGEFQGASVDVELGLGGDASIGTTRWSIDEPLVPVVMWLVITDREGGSGWSQYELESKP